MPEEAQLAAVVALLRRRGTDLNTVEVKASGRDLPKSIRDTLSAFSNDSGGLIVLGLEEHEGFRPLETFDAARMRNNLASTCADEMTPPVRADIEIEDFEGHQVVVATVPEMEPRQKPCFVTARGRYAGSFTRGGDGDRRLTEYEISMLTANHGQPRDDLEPVPGATLEDLASDDVAALLQRVRTRQPGAFATVSDEVALTRLGVLVRCDDGLAVSVAGLLAIGSYPQQFFPQLNVTFVSIPATRKDNIPADGPRFLDNRNITGSIPVMVQESVNTIIRNMGTRSTIRGTGREDIYDYPVEALREAVTNALMHRDYSPASRGSQVQIEMFQDRLLIQNPGGLFGTVTEDDLGAEGVSSSRNSTLATLLQDVALPGSRDVVCENRGTGIPAMIAALRRAGLGLPDFKNRIARFGVTFPKHSLLHQDTLRWIESLDSGPFTDTQAMALAMMRHGRVLTNAHLRQIGIDSRDASALLANLVARDLAVRTGGRRYATYVLGPRATEEPQPSLFDEQATPHSGHDQNAVTNPSPTPTGRRSRRDDRLAQITAQFADADGPLTTAEVAQLTGLKRAMAVRYINALVEAGKLVPTAPTTSRRRAYRNA